MKIDDMYLTLHVVVSNSIILLASVAMPGELKLGVKGLLAFGAGKVTVRFQMCLQSMHLVAFVCFRNKKKRKIVFSSTIATTLLVLSKLHIRSELAFSPSYSPSGGGVTAVHCQKCSVILDFDSQMTNSRK